MISPGPHVLKIFLYTEGFLGPNVLKIFLYTEGIPPGPHVLKIFLYTEGIPPGPNVCCTCTGGISLQEGFLLFYKENSEHSGILFNM